MTTESNKAVMRRWMEEVDGPRHTLSEAVLAPNFLAHIGGTPGPMNRDAFNQFVGVLYAGFPDLRHTTEDMFAEGDRVAWRVTFRGTHRAAFQGIPPTGKQINISGVAVARLSGGKVAEFWGNMDTMSLMQQIGAMSAPGQAAPPRR